MKENLGQGSSEEDSSDDDEEDSSSKKTTKISRRLPLGIKFGTDKATESLDIKPRLSIGERLMRQMELKSENAKEEQHNAIKKTDETPVDQPAGIVESEPEDKNTLKITEDETTVPNETLSDNKLAETTDLDATESHDEVPSDMQSTVKIPNEALEASEWGSEGEFGTDGEINLSQNEDVPTEKPEEDTESFAEVPSAPSVEAVEDELTVEPDLLESGIGDELPPEPPSIALESVPVAPERSVPAFGSPESPWYDAAAHDRLVRQHEEELHDVEYQAEKRGLRHGVGAGLFAGWLFGRRGKKKLIKEHTKELKTKNNEIKDLQNEQFAAKQRIDEIKRTQEHIRNNIEKEAKKPELKSTPEVTMAVAPGKTTETLHKEIEKVVVANSNENYINNTPRIAPEAVPLAAESTIVPAELIAVSTSTKENHPSLSERQTVPEKSLAEQEITEEMYETDEGRRIETSAWHRIEIDEKTGKPVENPNVAYGEEYKRERRQEILPEDYTGGSSNGPASVLGSIPASASAGSALVSIAAKQSQDVIQVEQPSPKDLPESHPHLTNGNNLLRYASKPLTWAVAVIIVVVLFLLGFLR